MYIPLIGHYIAMRQDAKKAKEAAKEKARKEEVGRQHREWVENLAAARRRMDELNRNSQAVVPQPGPVQDLLNPLNPFSPISPISIWNTPASASEPTPSRSYDCPVPSSTSDDSSRSSNYDSGSSYSSSCDSSNYDSGSSSSSSYD